MTSTEIEPVTGEILSGASTPTRFRMTPPEAAAWVKWVDDMKLAVLKEGPDYGIIQGVARPCLFKPGAEILLMASGMGASLTKIDDEDSRTHLGVTYRVTIRRGEQIVAECDGYAGYDEATYYKSAADNEASERYWAEKKQRKVNPAKFVEYKAPWNTLIKMAIKRAYVGAVLNATASSGLFTQDMEDDNPGAARGSVWDPTTLITPSLGLLDLAQQTQLETWWAKRGHPPMAELNAAQVAEILMRIGGMRAVAIERAQVAAAQTPSEASQRQDGPAATPGAEGGADGPPDASQPTPADDLDVAAWRGAEYLADAIAALDAVGAAEALIRRGRDPQPTIVQSRALLAELTGLSHAQ